jgi:hypothetical protein
VVRSWDEPIGLLRSFATNKHEVTRDRVRALAELLEAVRPEWGETVEAGTSMVNYLVFFNEGESFSWRAKVEAHYEAGDFEFSLTRRDVIEVARDRCHAQNAPAVLRAFLHMLVAEPKSVPHGPDAVRDEEPWRRDPSHALPMPPSPPLPGRRR